MRESLPLGATPAYRREVNYRRGRWKLFWLNLVLRQFAKSTFAPGADIAVMRRKQERIDTRFGRVDPVVRRTAADCDGVAAEWIDVPESRPDRVILYLHGGGFMLRFPQTHAAMVGRWCRRLGARALMVDYRLAPEDPYPAGLDDCHRAYRWLLRQGCEARRLVIAGDSAGGNLTLSTLQRARDAGDPLPACGVLLSPFVDFTLSSPSLITNEKRDPLFTLAGVASLRLRYAPPERLLDPGVSPLFGRFDGLPPLFFQAGGDEMLRDESVRAAERAHGAGVDVELELWSGVPHVFQAIAALPHAAAALENVADFVGRQAGWGAA